MKKNILAIIPARGGSKGIPKKNLKILAGKPLIYYTIQAARESKYINSIVVSTDDEDIFHISESFDVEVIKRPENLSRDDSPTIDVIFHVLEQSKIRVHKPNIVVLLQPTSPLRTSSDIDAAIELFLQRDCDSVVSVVQNVHPPHWNLVLEEKYLKPLLGEQFFTKRRQELPETYLPNGAIFIAETKTLKMYRSFYCPKTIPFIMSIEKSVDIDSLFDLFIAEEIIKKGDETYKDNKN